MLITECRRAVLFGCVAILAAACTGPSVLGQQTAAAAAATCDASATPTAHVYSPTAQLTAAYEASAAQVVAWQERSAGPSAPHPISQWRSHIATERVTVCYYDGLFDAFPRKGPPAPPPGVAPPPSPRPFERIILLVGQDGVPQLYVAGYRNTLPVTDPTAP